VELHTVSISMDLKLYEYCKGMRENYRPVRIFYKHIMWKNNALLLCFDRYRKYRVKEYITLIELILIQYKSNKP